MTAISTSSLEAIALGMAQFAVELPHYYCTAPSSAFPHEVTMKNKTISGADTRTERLPPRLFKTKGNHAIIRRGFYVFVAWCVSYTHPGCTPESKSAPKNQQP